MGYAIIWHRLTSLLHVNANPSTLVSAHFFSHPEFSCCIQLAQLPHTRCLPPTTLLLFGAIARLLALKKTYCTDFLVDELTLNTTHNHVTVMTVSVPPSDHLQTKIVQTNFYKYRKSPNVSKTDTSMYYTWAYTIYLIRI